MLYTDGGILRERLEWCAAVANGNRKQSLLTVRSAVTIATQSATRTVLVIVHYIASR